MIIISGILKEKLCQNPEKIIDAIIELFKGGYLDAYYCDGKKYHKLSTLSKKILMDHTKQLTSHNFTEFQDKEYYFQSTESSYKYLKEEDRPRRKNNKNP